MRAARGFDFGDGSDNHHFNPGDDVPDAIVKELGDEADHLILEKVLEKHPNELSREQLEDLARANVGASSPAIPEDGQEFNEDNFREGMSNFTKKADLIEWAETVLGIEGLNPKWNRETIEDSIIEAMTAEPESEEDDDDDSSGDADTNE